LIIGKKLIENKQIHYIIRIEHLFLMTLVMFFVSYNFHALWLVYDFLALFSLMYVLHLFLQKKKHAFIILSCIGILFSIMFIDILIYGLHSIMILSLWDNVKHIFIIYTLFSLIKKMDISRIDDFKKILFFIITFFFYIELIWVMYEYFFTSIHFDDITGFFGFHASHSVGYFSLLYIVILLYLKRTTKLYLFFVTLMAIIINYMSENVGFYILLVFFILVYDFRFSYTLLPMVLLLLFPKVYAFADKVILSRIFSFFTDTNNYLPEEGLVGTGRMPLLQYAIDLGNVFGGGIGAFSIIYNKTGYRIDELINTQLNISTATNLISEYGFFGFVVMLFMYIYVFSIFLDNKREKVMLGLLLLMAFFYNRVLMDERIIYMLIFIVLIVKLDFRKKQV